MACVFMAKCALFSIFFYYVWKIPFSKLVICERQQNMICLYTFYRFKWTCNKIVFIARFMKTTSNRDKFDFDCGKMVNLHINSLKIFYNFRKNSISLLKRTKKYCKTYTTGFDDHHFIAGSQILQNISTTINMLYHR